LGIAGTDGANLTGFAGFWEFDNTVNASNVITQGTDSSGNGNHLSPAGSPIRGKGVNYYAGAVSRWEDRSGRGNHLTQSTISKYPALVSAGIGSKPSIDFDGVDDMLLISAADALSTSAQGTVLAVVRSRDVGPTKTIVGSCDEASASYAWQLYTTNSTNGSRIGVYQQNGSGETVDTVWGKDTLTLDTDYLLAIRSDGNAYAQWRNGVSQAPLVVNTGANDGDWLGDTTRRDNFTLGGLRIGSSDAQWFNGLVAEVLVYETALTDAQRQRVERYLARKYGITLGA
jgi:hypothetical protein